MSPARSGDRAAVAGARQHGLQDGTAGDDDRDQPAGGSRPQREAPHPHDARRRLVRPAPRPPRCDPLEMMLMGFVGRGSYDASWRMKELGREPDITTKNIDALSADGIRFANCAQPPPPPSPDTPRRCPPGSPPCWPTAAAGCLPALLTRRGRAARRLRAADLHADALGAHVGAVLHPHRLRAHPLRYAPPALPTTPHQTLLSPPFPCLPALPLAMRDASSAHG
eukprot:COSAG04_NODE_346_length_16127_cov_10.497442_2_plen_224_part_00